MIEELLSVVISCWTIKQSVDTFGMILQVSFIPCLLHVISDIVPVSSLDWSSNVSELVCFNTSWEFRKKIKKALSYPSELMFQVVLE